MIRSFKDRDSERLWERNFVKQFAAIERQARMKLDRLDAAISLEDLNLPGMRLKKLAGDRAGLYSIVSTISTEFASGGTRHTQTT